MSDNKIMINGQLHAITECGCCGVVYTVPYKAHEHARRKGGFFHCPNGHQWGWDGKSSENAQLRLERDRLKQRLAQKDDAISSLEGSLTATKGVVTRMKNRAAAGVCPCCNRSFQNLRRHMHSKHPNYTKGEHLKVVGE